MIWYQKNIQVVSVAPCNRYPNVLNRTMGEIQAIIPVLKTNINATIFRVGICRPHRTGIGISRMMMSVTKINTAWYSVTWYSWNVVRHLAVAAIAKSYAPLLPVK